MLNDTGLVDVVLDGELYDFFEDDRETEAALALEEEFGLHDTETLEFAAQEAFADACMSRFDDDPSPYAGTYSEL